MTNINVEKLASAESPAAFKTLCNIPVKEVPVKFHLRETEVQRKVFPSIKVGKLAFAEFLAAFKTLCNIQVKDHESKWQLALSHETIRTAGKARDEAVQSALEAAGDSVDGRTYTFKSPDARKSFSATVKGIDAQVIELPLKAKVKLTVEEFGKLNSEQLGELLDIVEPPNEATA